VWEFVRRVRWPKYLFVFEYWLAREKIIEQSLIVVVIEHDTVEVDAG